MHLGRFDHVRPVTGIVREVVEEPGDVEGLGVVNEAHQHRANLDVGSNGIEVGYGINCHNPWLEIPDEFQHH